MLNKRKRHSPELKAKVALAVVALQAQCPNPLHDICHKPTPQIRHRPNTVYSPGKNG